LVTAAEMRRLDRHTIDVEGVSGETLMERAGGAAFAVMAEQLGPLARREAAVLAGRGNNGGDGYVVARHLAAAGARVTVWEAASGGQGLTPDAAHHRQLALAAGLEPRPLAEFSPDVLDWAAGHPPLVVDALLGTGLAGPPRERYAAAIEAINEAGRRGAVVIALDVPSGLDADGGSPLGPAVRAHVTVTFGLAKTGILQGPAIPYTGRVVLAPIGIDTATAQPAAVLSLPGAVGAHLRSMLPEPALAHKGLGGHCLIVGGSRGMGGAPWLAARGALRAGAGLVTIALPAAQAAAWGQLPEAMTLPLPDGGSGLFTPEALPVIEEFFNQRNIDAVVIGPGLGSRPDALAVAAGAWRAAAARGAPVVLDADALRLLHPQEGQAWDLPPVPSAGGDGEDPPLVLTPHPGEAARLLGWSTAEVQAHRPRAAAAIAARRPAVVVLKGARTLMASPGRPQRLSPVVDGALAAGGTGDVLAGITGALLAARRPPLAAAEAAVMIHGLAAALGAADVTGGFPGPAAGDSPAGQVAAAFAGGPWRRGLLAGEVAAWVPRAAALLASAGDQVEEALLEAYGLTGFTG